MLSCKLCQSRLPLKKLCEAFYKACTITTSSRSFQDVIPVDAEVERTPDPYIPVRPPLPIITKRDIQFPNMYREPKQAWVETLDVQDDEKLGMVDLHPDVFGTFPRLDILHRNIIWQRKYRHICYKFARSRAEMPGGGRKPWPQKGLGKARHGSRRSPIFKGGGATMGPRGPMSYYYMLSRSMRALGLRVALSVKFAQNDLHIVNNLDIPTGDPQYMQDLVATRFWGFSVLFVDDTDIMPENISLALNENNNYNIMPVYGLNVYSMLKHEKLVLTLAAVEKLEEKLLRELHTIKCNVSEKLRT